MRLLKNLPVKSGKFAEVLRSHQRSTVSSEATAERLLSSITTQDFTGKKGGYIYKSCFYCWDSLRTGCGSNSNSENINGTWTANLTNPDGSPAFNFTTNFTQQSGGWISITNFKFTTSGSAFQGPPPKPARLV